MSESPLYRSTINLVGVSHKTLPVDKREELARVISGKNTLEVVQEVNSQIGVTQGAVISTCNRFEILSVGEDREAEILSFIKKILPAVNLKECVYTLRNKEAVAHLFRVASSLDSLALGEVQILGQVKDAYRAAIEGQFAGKELHSLFQCAFRIAKRIRGETGVSEKGVSISYIAVQLAKKIFEELKGKSVLVIGSGKMAELTALHLKGNGCSDIIVANRTIEKAVDLASRLGGSAISLHEIPPALEKVDMVVSSIHADASIIEARTLRKRRSRAPLFLIDLGVPRNFSPGLADFDGVYLYNIDDLATIADENRALREEASKDAEVVIEYGVIRFESWLRKIGASSAIIELREQVRNLCNEEVGRALLGKVSKEDHVKIVDQITHGLSQKVAHQLQDILGVVTAGTVIGQNEKKLEQILPLVFDLLLRLDARS